MTRGGKDLSEIYQDALAALARLLFWLGLAVSFVCTGLLMYTVFRVADPAASAQADAARRNAQTFGTVLMPAVTAMGVGAATLFWGYDLMVGMLLIFSAILYFAPLWLPMIAGEIANDAARAALAALQTGGTVLGVLSIAITVVQVGLAVSERARHGAKADTLKIGKGIREITDVQNVFLGKCYQMPFCRKYVRERCPLFHAKSACWKERSGCMCEPKIITDAMANIVIPKDAVAAAKYIPRNGRLSNAEKAERCRNCVIYNEHQRQKYQAGLPMVIFGMVGAYIVLRIPGLVVLEGAVRSINKAVNSATLGGTSQANIPAFVLEGLFGVIVLVLLTYFLKMLEYAIFKLKI